MPADHDPFDSWLQESSEQVLLGPDASPVAVELSALELDDISGGVDIFLSGSMFEQNDALIAQSSPDGAALAKTSSTASASFQFIGLGFESNQNVLGALEGVYRIFGRQ